MYHLIHPTFIHFSLAFLIFGGLCEAWGLLTGREASARFGGQLVVLGVVSLAFTILSGYVAANTIPLTVEGQRLLDLHESNAWLVTGAFIGVLFWKAWGRGELPHMQRPFYVVLLLLAVGLTIYSGFLGGQLVYMEGAGVQGR